jgi:hypothetical protein
VRSKRGPGDQRLETALADLVNALNAARVSWMVIGGIAVIARGVRRMTTDIDAAVRGDQSDVGSLLRALAKHQIVARIDDAERFASESLVLLLKHQSTGVEFDVSMAWTDFEQEAIAAASITSFGSVEAPMARPEDLIVFKAIAGRPKDIEDATALFVLYPKLDRNRIRVRPRRSQCRGRHRWRRLTRFGSPHKVTQGAQSSPARRLFVELAKGRTVTTKGTTHSRGACAPAYVATGVTELYREVVLGEEPESDTKRKRR